MAYSTCENADINVSLWKLDGKDAFLMPGYLETTFILHSQHFMDLQNYVNVGIGLPDTSQSFEVLYPKHVINQKFSSLNKWNLYDIRGSKSYFAQDAHNSISDLIPILREVCDSQLDPTNSDVQDNLECAIDYLQNLMESCEGHKNRCEAVQQRITYFKNKTEKDKHDLDDVMQDLREIEPKLFAETEKKVKELHNQRLQVHAAGDEVVDRSQSSKRSKAMLLLGCVMYGIAWAVYVAHKVRLSGLLKNLEVLDADFQSTNQEAARLYHIPIELSQITERLGPVEEKIMQAIQAMDGIICVFSEMKTGLEDLAKKLDPKNVKHKNSGLRKMAVTRLECTLLTWKIVQEAAKQFQQTGLIKYVTISQMKAAKTA